MMKKGYNLMRCARDPEITDAVVATKTIWKNSAAMLEVSVSSTFASASSTPDTKSTSKVFILAKGVKLPSQPPSTPTNMRL